MRFTFIMFRSLTIDWTKPTHFCKAIFGHFRNSLNNFVWKHRTKNFETYQLNYIYLTQEKNLFHGADGTVSTSRGTTLLPKNIAKNLRALNIKWLRSRCCVQKTRNLFRNNLANSCSRNHYSAARLQLFFVDRATDFYMRSGRCVECLFFRSRTLDAFVDVLSVDDSWPNTLC